MDYIQRIFMFLRGTNQSHYQLDTRFDLASEIASFLTKDLGLNIS